MLELDFCRSFLSDFIVQKLGDAPSGSISVGLLLLGLFTALLMAALCRKLYAIPANLRKVDPDAWGPRFNGIRGMLILVAVVVMFEPFRIVFELICNIYLLREDVWTRFVLESPAGTWFGIYIGFTVVMVVARLMYANLMALTFINRRRVFRALAIGYLFVLCGDLLMDDLFLTQYFETGHMVLLENFKRLMQIITILVLAVPYLVFSRRVNATFRY
jgi:hypothetical protein